jgi:hypothetical protein
MGCQYNELFPYWLILEISYNGREKNQSYFNIQH